MDRRRLGLLFVSTLIVIISAFSRNINGQELASRSVNKTVMNTKSTKLIAKNFSYVLNDTITGIPCILTNMKVDVTVPYTTKDKKIANKTVRVPNNAKVDGRCSPVISEMKLIWKEDNAVKENAIKFTFINDHNNFSLFSVDLNIYVKETNSDNVNGEWVNATSNIDLHLFVASVTDGINKCKEEKVKADKAEINIQDVSLIAFYKNGDISARKEEQCREQKGETRTFPYVLRDKKNGICTLARMSISLEIPYRTDSLQNGTAIIQVPTTANVTGMCDLSKGIASMVLKWNPEVSENKTNTIAFGLERNELDSHVFLITANIFVDKTHFKNAQNTGEFIQMITTFDDLFSAPVENGMHSCPKKTFTTIGGITVTIRDVLLAAFDAQKDFASKQVIDCRSTFFEHGFTYIVRRNDTGVSCTLARMSINATVSYKNDASQVNKTLSVPSTAIVSGTCGNKSSKMTLSWSESAKHITTNKITFRIGRNETNFYVYKITATVYYDGNNNATDIHGESYNMQNLFTAPGINGLYNCTSLVHEIEMDNIHLNITNVTFIAFNTEEYLNPKNVSECSTNSDENTTTIPTTTTESPSVVGYPYIVRNEQNVPCIVANMSISIKVPYAMKSKMNQTTLKLPIGNKVHVSGMCENTTSKMELTWTEDSNADSQSEYKENKITFNFVNDSTNYFIRSINLSIYLDERNFPGANASGLYMDANTAKLDIFSTPLNNVYKCSDGTSVNAQNIDMTISNVSLIAFNKATSITSKSVNCVNNDSTDTDSDVGAIVGGVIGGLIIVCIIGYLGVMYRRKRGYGA